MSEEIPVLPVGRRTVGQRTDGTSIEQSQSLPRSSNLVVSKPETVVSDFYEGEFRTTRVKSVTKYTAEERTQIILNVLKNTLEFMTASEVARAYIDDPTNSDKVTTGNILQILAAAKVIRYETRPWGERTIRTYKV